MRSLRLPVVVAVVAALAALAACLAARARAADATYTLAPTTDASFPYACEWSWNYERACNWYVADSLPVGGDVARIWRAALAFDVSWLPQGVEPLGTTLRVWFDGTCVARSGTRGPCDGRPWTLAAVPVTTPVWAGQRELSLGDVADLEWLPPLAPPQWVSFDVSPIVFPWLAGAENDGLAIRLADDEEALLGSGPRFASSRATDASRRPRLELAYEGGDAAGLR
jgi:hypothetical protein